MSLSIENDDEGVNPPSDQSIFNQVNESEEKITNDISIEITKENAERVLDYSKRAVEELEKNYTFNKTERKYERKNNNYTAEYLPDTDCLYPNKTLYGACPCSDTKALCSLNEEKVKIKTKKFRFLEIPDTPISGTLGGILREFGPYGGRFRFNLFYKPTQKNKSDFGFTKALLYDFLRDRDFHAVKIAKAIANLHSFSSLHETIAALMDVLPQTTSLIDVGLALESYCETWDFNSGNPNFKVAAPCFHTRLLIKDANELCNICCEKVKGCKKDDFNRKLAHYYENLKFPEVKMINMDALAMAEFIKGATEKRTDPDSGPKNSMFNTVS